MGISDTFYGDKKNPTFDIYVCMSPAGLLSHSFIKRYLG